MGNQTRVHTMEEVKYDSCTCHSGCVEGTLIACKLCILRTSDRGFPALVQDSACDIMRTVKVYTSLTLTLLHQMKCGDMSSTWGCNIRLE